MSISVSRQLEHTGIMMDLHSRTMSVVFNVNVRSDFSEKETQQNLQKLGAFLENFETKHKAKDGDDFLYGISVKDNETFERIEDIETIQVRVGYAQAFQTAFNAEFE